MRTRFGLPLAATALLAAGVSLGAWLPQDAPPAGARSPELARLAAMEGLWDTETVISGMPPTTGLAKLLMMGDLWLIEEFKSEFGGQPFSGHGITGWDPEKLTYVNAWADTADPKLRVSALSWDEAQQALVGEPQAMDLGQGPASMRSTLRMPDADTMVFTLTPVAPDALPAMTITYKRNR